MQAIFVSHLVLITANAGLIALTGGLTGPLWPAVLGSTLGTLNIAFARLSCLTCVTA